MLFQFEIGQIPKQHEITKREWVLFLYIAGPRRCQVFRHHNYRGLPEVFYSSDTLGDLSTCLELCVNDYNCQSVQFDTDSNLCLRYDVTYGNQIIYAPGSDYYDVGPCDMRTPQGRWKRWTHKIWTRISFEDVVIMSVICKFIWCLANSLQISSINVQESVWRNYVSLLKLQWLHQIIPLLIMNVITYPGWY